MPRRPGQPRVLVLTPWYPSAERPLEAPFNQRHVDAIARFAEVRVLHVRMGSSAAASADEFGGRRIERLPFSPRRPLAALRTLGRIARASRRADVMHTMAFSAILAVAPVRFALPRAWVHTEHWSVFAGGGGHGVWGRRARLLAPLLKLPTLVTAVSSDLALALRPRVRRIAVVPNVVVADAPAPLPARPPLRLVTVGGLIDRKQPLMAVATVARLRELGHEAALTFVGDGPLAADVSAEAARLGVADAVTLAGPVPAAEVPRFLAEAHVFFLPTLSETFLVGAAEAIAAGRPVVLGGVGGFTDFVEPENGVVVADHDADAYAEALLDVASRLADPAAVAATIGTRLSPEAVGADFAALYADLLR